ncbi:alpha/beta hydrolase [Nonomuraea sp. NPDC049152]|uniref:alpha/beta hydrolase family protein n=1 Tax=Nonomuraea sp. NPDC049152 TaxID=3154350 RepID=UPI0033F34BC0
MRILVALLAVVLVLGGVVVWQNSYDMDAETVSIGRLHGVLTTPRDGRERHGLVVVVHGDGPVNATHDDGYQPIWEAFAQAGYATLSWDKPEDWLGQSMDDRADEVTSAIAWARARPDVDPRRVGLWGSSQAGWVLPKVAAKTPVAFVIAVSPAINWLQQGRYNLLAELRAEGASPDRIEREIAKSDTVRRLLREKASYADYVKTVGRATAMTAERWSFVAKNHTSDATEDLRALREIPVLLALGDHDLNVDTADTETVYRRELARLTVRRYADAAHSMVKHSIESSEPRLTLTAFFAPRSLFADGYLADQRRFLGSR